jgi:UDP-N-acetylmuramoyl-tripeptide--D-alanyl-D-alanine ligase
VKIEELYKIYIQSKSVRLPHDLEANDIEPGDLYFAWKISLSGQGIKGAIGEIWRFMEFKLPFLLKLAILSIKKYKKWSLYSGFQSNMIDGNAYANKAIKKEADYAVIDDIRSKNGPNFFFVENTSDTLINLAALHRKKMNTQFVGITGSCGKTTTKELTHLVLSTKYSVESTVDNHNCVPWIPQRILNFDENTEIGVIEMGVSSIGQLRKLCEIVQPHCGLITCIGKAHLEGFKSLEGVVKAKKELFEYLISVNGHIFKNINDATVTNVFNYYKNVTTYGTTKDADIYGKILNTTPFLTIRWYPSKKSKSEYHDVSTKLYGEYNLDNILSAISVGLYYDVPPKLINEAIQEYETINLRSQIKKLGKNTIILDAYNANPTSMRAALSNFDKMDADNKVVIIGDMLELGKSSIEEHRNIIFFTKNLNFNRTVFIGKEFGKARDPNFGLYFSKIKTAKKWFSQQNFINSHILLKASRGIAIERIVDR